MRGEDEGGATMQTVNKVIGRQITAAREMQGFTQQRLAEALGVTFQQVQKYESGVNRVSAASLWVIANALAVPLEHFFTGAYPADRPEGLSGDGGFSLTGTGLHETPSPLRPPGQDTERRAPARETADLLQAFHRIGDRSARQSVIAIVKNLADR